MNLRPGLIPIIASGTRGAENLFYFDLPVLCGQVPPPVDLNVRFRTFGMHEYG